jgi:CysZ protein
MYKLATGARDIGRGFAALNAHPSLWRWIIAPAVVTAVLAGALIAGVVHLVDPVHGWVGEHLPAVLARVAGSVLVILIVVVLSAGALLVFVPLAGMIAGPFNEQLSERLEAKLTGQRSPAFSLGGFVHGLALGIAHSIRRLIAALAGFVLVLAIGFVPVVGTIVAAVLAGWLAARGAAYDSYDAVFSRRSMSYSEKLAFLARHRSRTMGLGAGVAAMLFVPGINLVALGLGAAGATVAVHSIEGDPSARASSLARP